MILREVINFRPPRSNGKGHYVRKIKFLEMQCDVCTRQFNKKWSRFLLQKDYHFCGAKCVNFSQKKGGLLSNKKEKFFLEKYGTISPLTFLTGSSGAPLTNEIREKIRMTNIERYGVPYPMQSKEIMKKSKETCMEKYGVPHNAMRPEIQKISHNENSVEKMKNQLRNKDHTEMKQKMRKTVFEKYGVDHIMQADFAKEKRFSSLKKNGTIRISKKEYEFKNLLMEEFDKVVHQVFLQGFSIDFYIEDIETYVQFDGVYWHGLDRPISTISSSSKRIDKIIYSKWANDRKLDDLCSRLMIKLYRVTDVDFATKSREEIIKMIRGKNEIEVDSGILKRT